MSHKDILRRNRELIDNMYDMQDAVMDLADENECLNNENDILYNDNVELCEDNQDMKDSIDELHRRTRHYGRYTDNRSTGNRQARVENINVCGVEIPQEEQKPRCPLEPVPEKVDRRAISFYVSERTKNITMFSILIFLILLLAFGIDPNTAITYENIQNQFIDLFFNLYDMTILGVIGFILRRIWKKLK